MGDGKRLPYGTQWIDEEDVAAVERAARADFLTQGPGVVEFERALADAVGAPYAVAVSSGTAALHLAAVAAGVGPGDRALTSPLTFVATANAVVYAGGTPGFVDIDRATRNLSPTLLEAALADAAPGTVKLVTAVHYAGLPADMPAIARAARPRGAAVVEDAAHALGAAYGDETGAWHRVGACAHSDMTCFSFHPVKHVTTGEGGAVTTRSPELYERLLRLRSHGITRDPARLVEHDGPWHYEMQELGWNYRITDLQCALGRSQLRRLPAFVERRRAIAARYAAALADQEGVALPVEPAGRRSSYHLYPVWIDEERLGRSRREVFEALVARGLGVQVHYAPAHLQPFYRRLVGGAPGQHPEAERFYRGAISLPMFPRMDDADVDRVIADLRAVVGGRRA